jgi:hypothetical protein
LITHPNLITWRPLGNPPYRSACHL